MKTLKKILPLFGAAAVGAIPFTATSCSKVWVDLIEKQYTPTFERYKSKDNTGEITTIEARQAYLNYFLTHKDDIIPDFYWGASYFGNTWLKLEGTEVKTFLMRLSDMNLKETTGTTTIGSPSLSYHAKVQLELKHPGLAGSYAINTYDLDWQFNNIQVLPAHYATGDDGMQCWSLCPIKFDSYNSIWWYELQDDEQIKFDFKAVFKGYGKNGGQNYIRETGESAIIDEEHKYTPDLNEIYTNIMLFDSFYLSGVGPKIKFDDANIESTKQGETYVSDPLGLAIGEKTSTKYGQYKLHFSILNNKTYISSLLGSDAKVDYKDVQLPEPKLISEIKPEEEQKFWTFKPTFKITSGTPLPLDRLYYIIQMDCKENETSDPVWTDYLFVSTLIDVEE